MFRGPFEFDVAAPAPRRRNPLWVKFVADFAQGTFNIRNFLIFRRIP